MASTPRTQEVGSAVDDFRLHDIQGAERNLSAFLRGKKGAVVIFWSGVCAHCIRYDDYLNTFDQRHPDVALVAVASRSGETPEQIRKTVAERGLKFPILYDSGSVVARQWFTQQTPRSFLIDDNLTLLYRGAIDNYKFTGAADHVGYLEPALAEFLSGQPVTRAETASFGCAIQSVYYILPTSV